MRAHNRQNWNLNAISLRIFAATLALVCLGLTPQVASALEFTTYDVTQEGYGLWSISGHIDVNQEEGETAEISFGGAIAGDTTYTDIFGNFEHVFAAPYGAPVSFTASAPSGNSDTIDWILFDPSGEP